MTTGATRYPTTSSPMIAATSVSAPASAAAAFTSALNFGSATVPFWRGGSAQSNARTLHVGDETKRQEECDVEDDHVPERLLQADFRVFLPGGDDLQGDAPNDPRKDGPFRHGLG